MSISKSEHMVIWNLDQLSEKIIDIHDLKDDIESMRFSPFSILPYYKKTIKETNCSIAKLTKNWQYIPEHMQNHVSSAISYTTSIKEDIFEIIMRSPLANYELSYESHGHKHLDVSVSKCISILQSWQDAIIKIQNNQDQSKTLVYDASNINCMIMNIRNIVDNFTQEREHGLQLKLYTMHSHQRHPFIEKMPSMISLVVISYIQCINKHIDQCTEKLHRCIKLSTCGNIPMEEKQKISSYVLCVRSLYETMQYSISSYNLDIHKDAMAFYEKYNTFMETKKYYHLLTDVLPTVSHGQHIRQKSSGKF